MECPHCDHLGYWRTLQCLGGGGGLSPPLLSREPLVLESRARHYSKALHNTHPKHVIKLKIEVTYEVKVRSKVKLRRFDVLGPGTKIIEPDGSNSGKMGMVNPPPPGLFLYPPQPGGSDPTPPAISKTDGRRETDEAEFERSRRDASKPLSKI